MTDIEYTVQNGENRSCYSDLCGGGGVFMRMGRRVWALLVLPALLLGVLSGCNEGKNIVFEADTGAVQHQTDLTFFGYKYEALNVMAIEDALHGYMDDYPGVNIAYDGIKSPDYFSVLEKRLSTGNGDDIFMVDHERVLKLSGQGQLADLSDLSTLENFSDLARSQMAADGTIDYLPTSISAFGLYCNTALLKKHGQKIPENLAELEAVCDYFVSQKIIPIVANNDISLKTVVLAKGLLPVYQSADPAARIACLSSGQDDLTQVLAPGFSLVEKMLRRGWIDADEALNTAKTKDDLALFAAGERPFMLTGVWAVPRLRELEPDFSFEVRPYPILDDGSVLVINIDTRVSVNADSPHVEKAKEFVEYLTQKDVMWEFVDSQCSFSPLKDNRLSEDQAIQSISPYLTNGRSVIGADDNLQLPIWDLARQCTVGMLQGDSAEQATARMQLLIDQWRAQQTEVGTP